MDFLKAEIARKKAQLQKADVLVENKKYFKRGDLAAKEEEEYWKKHKRLKTDDAPKQVEQEKDEEPSAGSSKEDTDRIQMSRKEVIRRLRERGEPVRLFAESDYEAYQRMKKLEMLAPEITKGMENDMKTAMDRVDQEYIDELIESGGAIESDRSQAHNVKTKDDGTTLEDILTLATKFGTGDATLDQEVILRFCKMVLNVWGKELNNRSETEKQSIKGKLQAATHSQTVTYIKPLFKKLKNKSVPADILECLVEIIKFLLDRHYIKANDAYLEMAIGNAPWPIGVTMVGIHARTGREKIFAKNVAHVLNDETQRKYIQALKRLMTKAQQFFPTDPSRSVNYESKKQSVL